MKYMNDSFTKQHHSCSFTRTSLFRYGYGLFLYTLEENDDNRSSDIFAPSFAKSGGTSSSQTCFGKLICNICIQMVHLHTFTFLQKCFSSLTIEWANFEVLTSSKVMPVLRRANVSIFLGIDNLKSPRSLSLFTDHRHVDIHFAFHLINNPEYIPATQYIPHGNKFHPREIVGAKFIIVKGWFDRSPCSSINDDPFVSYERKENISI